MTRPSQDSKKNLRSRSPLSSQMEKHLHAYAVAAGSAGVALLACVQPAHAKIVSTKTNLTIDRFGLSVPIDLNGDGQNDFAFTYLSFGFAPSLTCTSARAPRHKGKHAAPPLGCGNFNFGLQLKPLQNNNEVWQMAGLEGVLTTCTGRVALMLRHNARRVPRSCSSSIGWSMTRSERPTSGWCQL
ncbi:MAG TPA: hypothetical protein VND65_02105, partial [Candidatus Binatia bacterium]|nr:hypothetical protein [Candidatus Binatia bacterium]